MRYLFWAGPLAFRVSQETKLVSRSFCLGSWKHVASRPKPLNFFPGRPNVWGQKSGNGKGPHLLFIGHTDTVRVDGWSERWCDTPRESPFAAAEVDGSIWGRGVTDLKGGFVLRWRLWTFSIAQACNSLVMISFLHS